MHLDLIVSTNTTAGFKATEGKDPHGRQPLALRGTFLMATIHVHVHAIKEPDEKEN